MLFLCICLAVPADAFALCFAPARPCAWYADHHGKPTFIGTVTAEETVHDVLRFGDRPIPLHVQRTTFNVDEAFEGVAATTETVYGEGTTNDFHFKVDGKYLVYGFRDKDGRIRTTQCTRTAPVSEAAEDIRFLRSLSTHVGGEIFGSVRLVNSGAKPGTLAGTIIVSGQDGDHQSRVTGSGEFGFKGLATGSYRAVFTPDGINTDFVTLKLSLPVSGSCTDSYVDLGDSSVSGVAVNDRGQPVPHATVFLFYALDGRFHPDIFLRTRTDTSGKFNFQLVEAAKYILAGLPAKSGKTSLPKAPDLSDTPVVEIRDVNSLSGLTVHISRSGKSY